MGLILPNSSNMATPDNPLGAPVIDMGEMIAKVAADVAAQVMNKGFEPSFNELIAPYQERIGTLEIEVKMLKAQIENLESD